MLLTVALGRDGNILFKEIVGVVPGVMVSRNP